MPGVKSKCESFESHKICHPTLSHADEHFNRLAVPLRAITFPSMPSIPLHSFDMTSLELETDEHLRPVMQHGVRSNHDFSL